LISFTASISFQPPRLFVDTAIKCTITSVSLVDWNIEPLFTKLFADAAALVRLPLCATAKPPKSQIGIDRLHVAQDGLARRGIPVMADSGVAFQFFNDFGFRKGRINKAHRLVRDRNLPVVRHDAARLPVRDVARREGPALSAPPRRQIHTRQTHRIRRGIYRHR
jgi:hypothetical protein